MDGPLSSLALRAGGPACARRPTRSPRWSGRRSAQGATTDGQRRRRAPAKDFGPSSTRDRLGHSGTPAARGTRSGARVRERAREVAARGLRAVEVALSALAGTTLTGGTFPTDARAARRVRARGARARPAPALAELFADAKRAGGGAPSTTLERRDSSGTTRTAPARPSCSTELSLPDVSSPHRGLGRADRDPRSSHLARTIERSHHSHDRPLAAESPPKRGTTTVPRGVDMQAHGCRQQSTASSCCSHDHRVRHTPSAPAPDRRLCERAGDPRGPDRRSARGRHGQRERSTGRPRSTETSGASTSTSTPQKVWTEYSAPYEYHRAGRVHGVRHEAL